MERKFLDTELLSDFRKIESKIDAVLETDFSFLSESAILGIVDTYHEKLAKGDIAGAYEFLDSEEVRKFTGLSIYASTLVECISICESILSYKDEIIRMRDEKYLSKDDYYTRGYTYGDLSVIFDKAERFIHSKKTYSLLRFLLKFESLEIDIIDRRMILKKMLDGSKAEEFKKIIEGRYSDEVGIVKTEYSGGKIDIAAGTDREMALSDLIRRPFAADMVSDYYDYHCEIKKSIHPPITEHHKKLVADEVQSKKELILATFAYDELGYVYLDSIIPSEVFYILVNGRQLIEHQLDPRRVGWKPISSLKLRVHSKKLSDVAKDRTRVVREIDSKLKSETSIEKESFIQKVKRIIKR